MCANCVRPRRHVADGIKERTRTVSRRERRVGFRHESEDRASAKFAVVIPQTISTCRYPSPETSFELHRQLRYRARFNEASGGIRLLGCGIRKGVKAPQDFRPPSRLLGPLRVGRRGRPNLFMPLESVRDALQTLLSHQRASLPGTKPPRCCNLRRGCWRRSRAVAGFGLRSRIGALRRNSPKLGGSGGARLTFDGADQAGC